MFRVKSGFDSENLMWLEQLFRQTVGDEMEIKRDDFNKILITKNVSYILIIYSYYARNSTLINIKYK